MVVHRNAVAHQGRFRAAHAILANLLNNAAKYRPEGRISLTAAQATRSCFACAIPASAFPESLSTIFNLFMQVEQTTRPFTGRPGIGLTLVKRLVE
jgi:signal transduction histidine kinase